MGTPARNEWSGEHRNQGPRMDRLWRIARTALVLAALGLSWWSCTRGRPKESAGELLPGVGLGSVRLGMTGNQVRALWGDPDIRVDMIWDYPSRCAVVTFDSEGAVKFVGIGNSAYPEKALEFCRGEGIEGGPRIGDAAEVARAKYQQHDDFLELPLKTGGSMIRIPSLRLHLELTASGVLHFAATHSDRPPRPSPPA